MKKINLMRSFSFLLIVMLSVSMAFGCGKKDETTTDAETAVVTEAAVTETDEAVDAAETVVATEEVEATEVTVLGDENAAYTFSLTVTDAEENTICYEVHSDEATVGQALFALEFIDDASFFSTVNGMTADWNADQAYWAVYVNEEYASVGVNEMELSAEETPAISFVYTVGM